jgi:integrase
MDLDKKYTYDELVEELKDIFRRETKLCKTTIDHQVTRIVKWVSYKKKHFLRELIYEIEDSMKVLEEEKSIKHTPENHHSYIGSVVSFIRHILKDSEVEEKWKAIEKENWKPVAERYDLNQPSERQKDKIMDFDEIERIRRTLEKGSFERLVISMYTLIEPVRADYYRTELIQEGEESKEENYIVLGNPYRMVLKDFKTKGSFKEITNIFSEELKEELDESLKKYPRNYLFVMDDRKSPYLSRNSFTSWGVRALKRGLNHPMSFTALRHIYITNKIKQKTPSSEMVEIAKRMGHARATQRLYEWQNKKEENE